MGNGSMSGILMQKSKEMSCDVTTLAFVFGNRVT